jgi:capsular exopolysaccharide synthesis family protein
MQLLSTQPVLDGVSQRLGYEVQKSQIAVRQSQETQIINLTVEDTNPQRAAEIANALPQVLTEYNDNMQSGRYASTEESIRAQIAEVEAQINTLQTDVDQINTQSFQQQLAEVEAQIQPLQAEVSVLQQEIAALEPALRQEARTQIAEKQARIDQIQPLLTVYQEIYSNLVVLGQPVDSGAPRSSRLEQLQSTLDLYQNLYLNLLSSLETIRLARLQNTPNIVQIEPATMPSAPIRPRPLQNALLAGAVGLMLAAGIVFLVEYLDDAIKTTEDVERLLQVPVIGYIAELKHHPKSDEGLYVVRQPRSPVSEAFRLLRTNLEFAGVDRPIRTLLVTSTGPNDGKTTVAVNLAAIIGQSGRQVVMVDGDLRRPKVHRFLGMANQFGLSDLFRGSVTVPMVSQKAPNLENVSVITTGGLPPNPAELLASLRMDHILDEAARAADIVIVDSPPSLVADVQILAAKVDGVIVVVQPGRTKADAALATMEQLQRAGARVVGVVLNRIPRHRADYYGGYRHYSPYYSGYQSYAAEADRETSSTPAKGLFGKRSFGSNGHKVKEQDKPSTRTGD